VQNQKELPTPKETPWEYEPVPPFSYSVATNLDVNRVYMGIVSPPQLRYSQQNNTEKNTTGKNVKWFKVRIKIVL